MIARLLHDLSAARRGQFVPVNCAAIPGPLLESELFGYERGAFTGALTQKAGRFEAADRGTLFLDEIGELPLDMQPKLLRALQENQFERLGSSRSVSVDVRLVAATNQNLAQMVQEKKFRADLFYRLNVFPISLPPLRERVEDIPHLAHHFVAKYSERFGRCVEHIPREVMTRCRLPLARQHPRIAKLSGAFRNPVHRQGIGGEDRGSGFGRRGHGSRANAGGCAARADRRDIARDERRGGRTKRRRCQARVPRTTLIATMRRLGIDNPVIGQPRRAPDAECVPSKSFSGYGQYVASPWVA